jgi:DNA-binding transcriptional regulator YiaG
LETIVKQAVICLTVTPKRPDYSRYKDVKYEHGCMSDNCPENESPLSALKSESARQRWDLFHRAIAHAKQSNSAALQESETTASKPSGSGQLLTIVR